MNDPSRERPYQSRSVGLVGDFIHTLRDCSLDDLASKLLIKSARSSILRRDHPWANPYTRIYGLRLRIEGDVSNYWELISALSQLSGEIYPDPSLSFSLSDTCWLFIPFASSPPLSLIFQCVHQYSENNFVESHLFEPICPRGICWRDLSSSYVLHPQVSAADLEEVVMLYAPQRMIFFGGEQPHLSLLASTEMGVADRSDFEQRLITQLDAHQEFLANSEDTPLRSKAPSFVKRRQPTPLAGLLFLDRESEERLCEWSLNRWGHRLLMSIERYKSSTSGGLGVTAWFTSDRHILEEIYHCFVEEKGHLINGHYVSPIASLYHQEELWSERVWSPITHTLSPLPPARDLLHWFFSPEDIHEDRRVYLFPKDDHVEVLQLIPDLSVGHMLHLTLQHQLVESRNIHTLWTPCPVQLHFIQGEVETVNQSSMNGVADRLAKLPNDNGLSPEGGDHPTGEVAMQYSDHGNLENQNSISPHTLSLSEKEKQIEDVKEKGLSPRERLRTVTFPHHEKHVSLKERAHVWLSSLSENTPRLLVGEKAPLEWSSLAHQLWLLGKKERALRALTWALLEDVVLCETNDEHTQAPLAGWSDRLNETSDYEWEHVTRWLLLSLRELSRRMSNSTPRLLSQSEESELNDLMSRLVTAEGDTALYTWLFSYVWIQDEWFILRMSEMASQSLTLGLPITVVDPVIVRAVFGTLIEVESATDQGAHIGSQSHFINWLLSLLDRWTDRLRCPQPGDALTLLAVIEVSISGLKQIFLPNELLPVTPHLPIDVAEAIWSQYHHSEVRDAKQSERSRSVIKRFPATQRWRERSSLYWKKIEATPLISSTKSSPLMVATSENDRTLTRHHLELSLRRLLREMRSVVKTYYGLREVVRKSIDQALKRGDQSWIDLCIEALNRWCDELIHIPTAPQDLPPHLDLQRLRLLSLRVTQSEITSEMTQWIQRWLLRQVDKPVRPWRLAKQIAHDFAMTSLDTLSSYLDGDALLNLSDQILHSLEESFENDQGLPEANADLIVYRCLRSLIWTKLVRAIPDHPQSENLSTRRDYSFRQLTEALEVWVVTESSRTATQRGSQGLGQPLASWGYHLLTYPREALDSLSQAWSELIDRLNGEEVSQLWFLFEHAILCTPIFDQSNDERLSPWLRGRERVLRSAWDILKARSSSPR